MSDAINIQVSEDELALSFARNNPNHRWVDAWGQWWVWSGTVWERDSTLHVFDAVRAHVRDSSWMANTPKSMLKAATIAAVERLCRSDRAYAASTDQWDADPWRLNTPGGIQAIEEFPFLSAVPTMREWIGGRQAKGLDGKVIRIANKHWEATLEFKTSELRRDKTSQTAIRIGELAGRAAAHPRSLLSTLLLNGETSLCYDGQFFFDTDHAEGDSGSQSNSITVDIASLNVPLAQQGTTTAPSGWVLAEAIARTISHFKTLRDDVNEPLHQTAKRFLVMVPVGLLRASQEARKDQFSFDVANILAALPYEITLEINPCLTWTDKFAVFRTDSDVKPLIHQVETEVSVKAKAEGSEFEFNTDRQQFGIDQWSNVEYGFWQYAILSQLV